MRAVVAGAETLLGKDLCDWLAERAPEIKVKRYSGSDEAILTGGDEEAGVITPLEEETLRGADLVFLAGSADTARHAFDLTARDAVPPALIDLSHGLEALPEAQIRAPLAEPDGWTPVSGRVHVIAHPAAIALGIFLGRLVQRHRIRGVVATVLEPASERGRRGVDELQKQTIQLLSFRSLPQEVFDAQLSFNLLPRYGTEAPEALESFELRMDRHLATLASRFGGLPMPSIRLAQAPVFHGHSISVWVEFESRPSAAELGATLADSAIELRSGDVEPPCNTAVANQCGIAMDTPEIDRTHPRGAWFWIVADNHRLMSENAVLAARALPARKAAL